MKMNATEDDIDAVVVRVEDIEGDMTWGAGDTIMFSLWPAGTFDGGEIWVWRNGSAPQFLAHGGRVWDTPNPVGSIFGVNTENINALEAIPVPEPLTISLLIAAILGLFAVRP